MLGSSRIELLPRASFYRARFVLVRLGIIISLVAHSGCAFLTIEKRNPVPVKLSKFIGRTILGVSSFGLSEISYAQRRKCLNARRRMDAWLNSHINQAVAQLGPPSAVNEGYGGNRLYMVEFMELCRSGAGGSELLHI